MHDSPNIHLTIPFLVYMYVCLCSSPKFCCSFWCSVISSRGSISLQPRYAYLHRTSSRGHFCLCLGRSQRKALSVHPSLGQTTSIFAHSCWCLVVLSWYPPVSLQCGHSYGRLGHSAACFSISFLSTVVILFCWFSHLFGHGSRLKSHDASCWPSSPTNSQPLQWLSHSTLRHLIVLSPAKC